MLWLLGVWTVLAGEIVVGTLNIGHGRGQGHQILQSKSMILENVACVGATVCDASLDILALQEVDAHAWWSGYENQVELLGNYYNLPNHTMGIHNPRPRLQYGTSLVTRFDILNAVSTRYPSSFPLPSKGFVLIEVEIDGLKVAVVSLHLDPLRATVRQEQVQQVVQALQDIQHPRIIMGDLNIEWGEELEGYCQQLGVKAYEPFGRMPTFPKFNRRLDWILVSEAFTFVEYLTSETFISDHAMVRARLQLDPYD